VHPAVSAFSILSTCHQRTASNCMLPLLILYYILLSICIMLLYYRLLFILYIVVILYVVVLLLLYCRLVLYCKLVLYSLKLHAASVDIIPYIVIILYTLIILYIVIIQPEIACSLYCCRMHACLYVGHVRERLCFSTRTRACEQESVNTRVRMHSPCLCNALHSPCLCNALHSPCLCNALVLVQAGRGACADRSIPGRRRLICMP